MKKHLFFLTILYTISTYIYAYNDNNIRYHLLSGMGVSKDSKSFWNQAYNRKSFVYGKAPASFLVLTHKYFKQHAKILDMGMGEGRNAVYLAQLGFNVTGIDISSIAIKKARLLAKEKKVTIKTITASLNKYDFKDNSFDGIIVFYYVDRSLNKKIMKWLKPGGILIYEALSINKKNKTISNKHAQNNSDYLKEAELLTMFPNTKIIEFKEPINQKKFTSSIVLQKRFSTQNKQRTETK